MPMALRANRPTAHDGSPRRRSSRPGRALSVGLVVIVAVTACSSGAPTKAERGRKAAAAAEHVTQLRVTGKTAAAWDLLVTHQQEILPEAEFAKCVETPQISDFAAEVAGIHEETIRIPGTRETGETRRVELTVTGTSDGSAVDEPMSLSVSEVKDEWRWILDPDEIADCPVPELEPEED